MATVEYDRIVKNFGSYKVLEEINLKVDDHRFVVLLGPSGCGKTTLLRITAGLETITGGELRIDGQRVNGVHPRNRDIAMVFQTYALYPQMSVFENIAFSLQVHKVPTEEIKHKVQWAAEVLDLTAYLDHPPRSLSGGQRQRVAMGRALVRNPKVFLFDEPLSNLDAKLRSQMRYEILRIHDRLDTTTVYVTHDQIEAMTMADEVVVMRDGNIEQYGTPNHIYDRPANAFVADFIGSPAINFFAGTVEAVEGRPVVRFGTMLLPLPQTCSAQSGQTVLYGVRPVDMTLDEGSDQRGKVLLAETTGAETLLHLDVENQKIRLIVPGRSDIKRGDTVGFRFDPAHAHLFDARTEQRIE